MFKGAVRGLFLSGLILISGFSLAQFSNTLITKKPKPVVTKSEMDGDSAHYVDKPSTFKDKKTNISHTVYTEFDKFKSAAAKDSSYIVYWRTAAHSKAWSKGQRISKFPGDCSNGDNTLKADVPCAGINGEIYVCWAGPKGLCFQRSLDTGATWLPEEKVIAPIKNGWDQRVEGLKTNGIPRMVCADSGQYRGRVYIAWSDEKNGMKNKDVFLVYSDDRGDNWTDPILLTYRPNHKDQFNPAIEVQPGTGHLYVTYFDRQNYIDGTLCDLYLAISTNGGLKFDPYRLNEKPVKLDSNIASVRGLAFVPKSREVKAIWSQINEENMLVIFSAVINDSTIAAYNADEITGELKTDKTIPYAKKIKMYIEMKQDAVVSAYLTKPLDPSYSQEVIGEAPFKKGLNELTVDMKKLKAPNGNYVVTLYYNNRNSFVWITEK
jgi:hypothetical protein